MKALFKFFSYMFMVVISTLSYIIVVDVDYKIMGNNEHLLLLSVIYALVVIIIFIQTKLYTTEDKE